MASKNDQDFIAFCDKLRRIFKKMYATIPHGAATRVWHGFPERISRRQSYRLLNGEVMLLTED